MLNKNVKKRTYHSCPSGLPAPTFPDANAALVYPINSCQLSPTLTSSLCNPQNTPSSMDQNAKTLCQSLYCQDCSGSSLNLKIFYNFKGMDRPWMFCMSLSIANKTLCQQSNLTLIHSHNNVLTGAPKGGRKWGRNGLLSCPCKIWERITKNCTSSPSSPMLFSTIHVLEWKSVMKNCRWLSSFACRQNKRDIAPGKLLLHSGLALSCILAWSLLKFPPLLYYIGIQHKYIKTPFHLNKSAV